MDGRTQQEIDKIANKVLREVGFKEPPVDIQAVLSHLNLHCDYYDLEDPSLAAEIKHALKIGWDRMAGILRKIRFLGATIPEQRRIFIDKSIHQNKQKWATLHEATHNLLPWHKAFYSHVDTAESLNPDFQEQLESEANYGAKQFLFMGESFKQMALESKPSMKSISELQDLYQTSWEATLRYYVENTHDVPMMLIVCPPFWDMEPSDKYYQRGWRYFVRSRLCATMFPNLRTEAVMKLIKRETITSPAVIDFMEPIQIAGPDISGNRHQFTIELLHNGYDIFVMVLPEKPLPVSVAFPKKVV